MRKVIQQHRKPIALTVLLVVLGLVAGYKLFFGTQHITPRTPVNVTVASIGTMNKPIRIDRAGSVGNSSSVPVNTEFSGVLSEIYITEGQTVKAGQPLFKIQASTVSSSDSDSTVTTASPRAGTSQQAQDNYDNALKDFNRYQKLYEIGAIPRRQLDDAAARLQTAQEGLSNDKSTISSTNAATRTLNGSTTVEAPIDGIVMGLAAVSGKTVQAGQQLMALGSGQEVEIVVHLEQNDLYLVHLGTAAAIEVSGQTITGQVSSIYPEVDANQISSFLAHIKLTNNPGELLKPGMSVNVHIDTGTSAPVLALPTVSIFQDEQGRSFIYMASNGTAIRQPISIGETIGDFTELTSNVPQETMVITSNIDKMKNGQAIAIIQ